MKTLESFPLYNGEIILQFDPVKHQYFVGEQQIDGCTGILGVLNKPALLPWGVNMAVGYMADNLKPGVAYDELEIKALLAAAKKAHTIKRDSAADVGTLIHQWCEDHIKGKNPPMPVNEQLKQGVQAFLDWVYKHGVDFTLSERKIFSRRYRYAGTLDAEGYVDNKLAIIDFKTGAAIYHEARLQTASYTAARCEEEGKQYTRWIIRLGKDDGEFEAKEYGDLDKDFRGFLGAFEAYKRLKELRIAEQQKKKISLASTLTL